MRGNILSAVKNFDEFVAIDWSGAKTPIQNPKISMACYDPRLQDIPLFPRPRWSRCDVFDWITARTQTKNRTLIGIDCNFGWSYDRGLSLCGNVFSAYDLWRLVDETCNDDQNFYAENFWQHPTYQSLFWSSGTKPNWFDGSSLQRRVEIICSQKNLGNPESPFKLIGTKQVGKGGMSGMRLLYQLKQILGNQIAIWPFDSVEELNQATIVITEIYPRLFWKMTGLGNKKITSPDLIQTAVRAFNPSMNIPNDICLSDDQSDAFISAIGLSYLCGKSEYVPNAITFPSELPIKLAKTEGWIFGV